MWMALPFHPLPTFKDAYFDKDATIFVPYFKGEGRKGIRTAE